ncbi:MAG: Peroxide-responsive repressor PerR [Alphaproteobacteria bacterium MarineAlpha5_Bin9]|nr:MAG: Peroxide-responsive repressor PerR [Alphaproteobacteria bacterium MarineAlpha5_Bin9]|tara:strand:+ start:1281 stop:1727 length:447 start_codon:yes stop_codon:yes gene_type:complete
MLKKIQPFNPLSNYNLAIKKLKSHNIRPTKQRMVLSKILFEKGNKHITAEELYEEVRKQERKISLATIYNTLKQFCKLGLLKEVIIDQNKSIYCSNNKQHYHLYIEDENKIIDIPHNKINIDFNVPEIPACLNLHNVDIIIKIKTKNN